MSVLDEIIKKIPVNLQLSFEMILTFGMFINIQATTLILHEHEITFGDKVFPC